MRICYIATTTHISKGLGEGLGSSVHTYALAKELKKLGNHICIVSEGFAGDMKEETIKGIKIYRLRRGVIADSRRVKGSSAAGLLKHLKPISSLLLGFKAAGIARRENCGIILERAQRLGAGAVASWIAGKPLAVEVIDNLFSGFSLRHAKKIFAYTDVFFGKKTKNKISIIGSGFDAGLFKPADVREEFDLCYCGSFKEWDGLEDLVRAVGMLKTGKDLGGVRVLMVGKGAMLEKIRRMVKEHGLEKNFVFAGRVPLGKVPALINSAKVCVAPFNVSNCAKGEFEKYGYYFAPLKVVEYMACGKPIVASDYATISGTLQGGEQVFEPGNAGELAEKIGVLVGDKTKRKALGRRNLKLSKNHTWAKVAQFMNREMGALV